MARQYLVGSWAGADTYDYSGEQLMGNRRGVSGNADHFLANGKANTWRYSDTPHKKPKVQRSIVESISLPDSHLNRLEKLSERLEAEAHTVGIEEYAYLRRHLDERIERAQRRLFKARKWDIKEKDLDKPFIHSISYTQKHKDSFMDSISDENIFKIVWTKAQKVIKLIAMIRMELKK